jgi:hypothetical protein
MCITIGVYKAQNITLKLKSIFKKLAILQQNEKQNYVLLEIPNFYSILYNKRLKYFLNPIENLTLLII